MRSSAQPLVGTSRMMIERLVRLSSSGQSSKLEQLRKAKKVTPRQLIRTAATLEVHPEQWPNMLLALQDAGWVPHRSVLSYLAPGTIVSDEEAHEMLLFADTSPV